MAKTPGLPVPSPVEDKRTQSTSSRSYSLKNSPGSDPITFEVDGYRFGCALGMESHFPEVRLAGIDDDALGCGHLPYSGPGRGPAVAKLAPFSVAFGVRVLPSVPKDSNRKACLLWRSGDSSSKRT